MQQFVLLLLCLFFLYNYSSSTSSTSSTFRNGVECSFSRPVDYSMELLTASPKYSSFYFFRSAMLSSSSRKVQFITSNDDFLEFDLESGDITHVTSCIFTPCFNKLQKNQVIASNQSTIKIRHFYQQEGENVMYLSGSGTVYALDRKEGLIRLLSDNETGTMARAGVPIKEATFRYVHSITKDSIGNLYIADENVIFKVDLDGVLHQITATGEADLINRRDGYSNQTKIGNTYFITHRNGYLYGTLVNAVFKINLETGWLTFIQATLDGSKILPNGIAFLSDDLIVTLDREIKSVVTINQTSLVSKRGVTLGETSFPSLIGNDLLANEAQILKFDLLTGKISPIFDGSLGAVGNGMLLSNREFQSISAIAFNESSGELFITDSSATNTVHKIDNLNRVQIIPLSFSNISCWNSSVETKNTISFNPVALEIKDSNLYLANTGIQSSIQKFDLSKSGASGCFYAGSISSDRLLTRTEPLSVILNNPNGIHCSTSKDVYIADTNNHRILKNTVGGQIVEVISGNGIRGFSGDGGLAVQAQLDRPHSIYYEELTNVLYIADSGNHRIRYVNMVTGIISTLIGNGIPGFNGDNMNPLETQLNFPKYIVNSPSWGLFISDSNNHRVRLFTNSTISTILGSGNSGPTIIINNPKLTELNMPFGLFVRSDNLWIADSFNHRILLLSLDTNIVSIIAGTSLQGFNGDGMNPTQAQLFLPTSVYVKKMWENNDIIYIADSYNNRVRLIRDGIISTIGMTSQKITLNMPLDICVNAIGEVLISSENQVLSIYTSLEKKYGGLGDGLHVFNANVNPTKIIFHPDNRMVISESGSNRIRLVEANGTISTIAGNGKFGYGGDSREATSATLSSPTGISFSPDFATLYFSDSSNNRIRKLVSNNVFLVAGTGDSGNFYDSDPLKSQFNNPRLISTLTNGDVVIGDILNNQILIISNKEGKIRKIGDVLSATDMVSTRDNTLYISTSDMIFKAIPVCETGFELVRNNTECVPICYGKVENETCSKHGECISPNNCKCLDGLFTGKECEIPICYGVAANDPSVCSYANGTCIDNKCNCNSGFNGNMCEIPICFDKPIGESCGGRIRGTCINKDKCLCFDHFSGERCELRMCSGRSENDPQICNGHGKCVENGRCECDTLYSGLDCSDVTQIYVLSVVGSIVLILIVFMVLSLILGLTVYRNNKKERKILETELSLEERLLAPTEAHELSFTDASAEDSSFIIPLHKIGMDKPIKRLGEGGMGSVFMTKFNGMTVAVKVFDLNNLNISEEDFKNEAIVLSKLRHPNIINFYGVSTSPTKRYIIMECLDQSLDKLVAKMEMKQVSYLLDQKLRMMLNIANGIEYLHNLKPRRIIHRDLKTANILLDSNGNCKVCDFGLSKSISQATVSALTNQLGTHYYMSPELFDTKPIDPTYATSVDIYSFSIIMWQILFEIRDPYQSKSPEILKKLGTNPLESLTSYQLTKMICEQNHRPVIPFTSIDSCREWCSQYMPSKQDESSMVFNLAELIQQCWQADPKLRPNIEQVIQQLEFISRY